MKFQPLELNKVTSADKSTPLFVMNSSMKTFPPGGNVYVAVSWKGAVKNLEVPKTWVPIELTASMPREAIVDSMYFLEAVQKGLITPITEESARIILAQPDAKAELRRISEAARAVQEAVRSRGISKNVTISGMNEDEEEAKETGAVKKKGVSLVSMEEESSEGEPSAQFKAWVNKLNTLENESEALNEIKRRGEMEAEEAWYMVNNIKHARIAELVRSKLED